MKGIIYSKAQKSDAEDICNLTSIIYPKGYPKLWYREGIDTLEDTIAENDFFKATENGNLIGCVALNNNYWKGIPVSYLESLMVNPSAQDKGVGKGLMNKAKEESNQSIISLDRSTSVRMMLRMGFEPFAFIPEKEYFGDKKESLFLVHYPKLSKQSICIGDEELNARLKKKDEQPYLLEIVGNELNSEKVSSFVNKHNYSEYVITIDHFNNESSKKYIQINGCKKTILGNLNLDHSNVEISLFINKKVDRNFPLDVGRFIEKCETEEAKNMIRNTVNELRFKEW